jgi:DNA-binding transcriptional ArsR family regulator
VTAGEGRFGGNRSVGAVDSWHDRSPRFGSSALGSATAPTDQIAPVAALLADPARVAMLWALSDGRRRPAGELARCAGVRPSTASAHLARLLEADLIRVEQLGRHRFYRLAESRLVEAMEVLSTVSAAAHPCRAAAAPGLDPALRRARMCYDHVAGELGAGIARALEEARCLERHEQAYLVTESGLSRFEALGLSVDRLAAAAPRRPLARACLDWSERRFHLAGVLGAALATRFLDLGWVDRHPGSRALRISNEGRRAFRREFGLLLY